MSSSQSATIVLPVYKERLSRYETISLQRCAEVFSGSHSILLIAPDGLDLSDYQIPGFSYQVRRFSPKYFTGISGYNEFMLSPRLYDCVDTEFILIYQLDAFVFSDQLAEWCDLGFDYVGAPWLNGIELQPYRFSGARPIGKALRVWNKPSTCYVGNGGFSLRRVSTCRELISSVSWRKKVWKGNEDYFYSLHCKLSSKQVPDIQTAARFAFEQQPATCYDLTGQTLPFGCHAWEKWDVDFWRPQFAKFGYEI